MSLPESLQTVCNFIQDYVNKTYRGSSLEFKIFQCSKAMTRVLYNRKFRLYQFAVKALKIDAEPSQPLDMQYRTYCNCTVVCDATNSPADDKAITAVGYLEDIQDIIQITCSPILLKYNPAFSSSYDRCLRLNVVDGHDGEVITLYQDPILTFESEIIIGPEYPSFIEQSLHVPRTILDTPLDSFNEAYIPVMDKCSTPYISTSMPWCFAAAMLSIINKNRVQDSAKAVRLEAFVKLIYKSVWDKCDSLNGTRLTYKNDKDIERKCTSFREEAEKEFGFKFEDSVDTQATLEKDFKASDALEPYKHLFSTDNNTAKLATDSTLKSMITNLFNLWNYTGSHVTANNTKLYGYIKDKISDGYSDIVCIEASRIGSNNDNGGTTDAKHAAILFSVDDANNSIWVADSRIGESLGLPKYIVVKTLSLASTIPFVFACTAFDYVYEITVQSFFKHKNEDTINSVGEVCMNQQIGKVSNQVPDTFIQVNNEMIAALQILKYDAGVPFQSSVETNSLGYAMALTINFLEKSEHSLVAGLDSALYTVKQKREFLTHLISPDNIKDLLEMNSTIESERDIIRYVQYIFKMKGYEVKYLSMNTDIANVLKQYITEKYIKNQNIGYGLKDVHSCCLLIYSKYTVVTRNGQEVPGTLVGVQALLAIGYDENSFKTYTYNKDGTVKEIDIPINEAYKHKVSLDNDDGTTSNYFLYSGYVITGLGYSSNEAKCTKVDII